MVEEKPHVRLASQHCVERPFVEDLETLTIDQFRRRIESGRIAVKMTPIAGVGGSRFDVRKLTPTSPDCRELARRGGVLNCCSWTIKIALQSNPL